MQCCSSAIETGANSCAADNGLCHMQMVTYGKPPFWMLNVINPKSPQELQEEVIDVRVCAKPHRASNGGSH